MGKIVDENGFWLIKNNPVSKAGVFPYLGRSISPVLDPDKLYNVLRPEEELSSEKTLSSFADSPLMLQKTVNVSRPSVRVYANTCGCSRSIIAKSP